MTSLFRIAPLLLALPAFAGIVHPADKPPAPTITVPAGHRDPETFAFAKNDVVAIIGNGLADRMQHDGWTETFLQIAQPDKDLTFRNLSHTGDRPGHYPR